MLATISVISAWLQLLIGLALLVVAPLFYRIEPMIYERVQAIWRFKSRSGALRDFRRIGGTLFLFIVGSLLVIGSFVRFA